MGTQWGKQTKSTKPGLRQKAGLPLIDCRTVLHADIMLMLLSSYYSNANNNKKIFRPLEANVYGCTRTALIQATWLFSLTQSGWALSNTAEAYSMHCPRWKKNHKSYSISVNVIYIHRAKIQKCKNIKHIPDIVRHFVLCCLLISMVSIHFESS